MPVDFCSNLRVTFEFELRALTLLFPIGGIALLDFYLPLNLSIAVAMLDFTHIFLNVR